MEEASRAAGSSAPLELRKTVDKCVDVALECAAVESARSWTHQAGV